MRYLGATSLCVLLATLPAGARADDGGAIVSLVALVSNPERYAGQKVLVTGFCSLGFEDTAVYLHEEDYRRTLTPNSIWLELVPPHSGRPNPAHENYCLVEGNFSSEAARNGRGGRLHDITRLEVLPSRAELAAKLRQ